MGHEKSVGRGFVRQVRDARCVPPQVASRQETQPTFHHPSKCHTPMEVVLTSVRNQTAPGPTEQPPHTCCTARSCLRRLRSSCLRFRSKMPARRLSSVSSGGNTCAGSRVSSLFALCSFQPAVRTALLLQPRLNGRPTTRALGLAFDHSKPVRGYNPDPRDLCRIWSAERTPAVEQGIVAGAGDLQPQERPHGRPHGVPGRPRKE
jgi:hypothetical protein